MIFFHKVWGNIPQKSKNLIFLSLLLTLVLLGASGCATTQNEPQQTETIADCIGGWTQTELADELGGKDPIEGFNRAMFSVTDFVMVWVAQPLGIIYTTILPRPVIEGIDNICKNLEFPAHAVSCLGQAEWRAAWDETARFLLNTTIGIAGIFDPAAYWFDIYPTDSDFGLMFCRWGIGPGCTFMLPLMPTINIRDTVGYLFDTAFDIKTYIPYAGYATFLNRLTIAQDNYSKLVEGSSDPYKSYREMMLIRRELQRRMWFYHAKNAAAAYRKGIAEGTISVDKPETEEPILPPEWITANWKRIPGYRPQSAVIDTMRVAWFSAQKDNDPWYMRLSLFNSDFSQKCKKRKLYLAPDNPPLHYGFWAPPEGGKDDKGQPIILPEKLAILLPGIGGNYYGMTSTALAELLNDHGYAVLSLDSPFAWEFMLAIGNKRLPGFLPDDAAEIRDFLPIILDSLKEDELIKDPKIVMLGYSMGALETLKISELEEKDNTLNIERYLAINPPVELSHAIDQADRLAQTGSEWDSKKAIDEVSEIVGKGLSVLAQAAPPYDPEKNIDSNFDYQLMVSSEQSEFVAAIYFKICLRHLLLLAHKERNLPQFKNEYHWGKRNALYHEIDKIDFRTYAEEFLKFEYPELALNELYRQSGMSAFAESLKRNSKLRVIHNYDDFLLTETDRKWLDAVFKERLTWFEHGGHLGNLYVKTVQDQIIADLEVAPASVNLQQDGELEGESHDQRN